MDSRICPESGHQMFRDVRPVTLTYKGHSETFDMPGWYCDGCGESIRNGEDMKTSNRMLDRVKAKVDGPVGADETVPNHETATVKAVLRYRTAS